MTAMKTTKKELTKKIAELQAQVDAMPDEPSGYWKPEYGYDYWSVDNGFITVDCWTSCRADLFRLSQGNVFRTKEEAKHHKKKLEVLGKMRLAAMEDIAENGELEWGIHCKRQHRLQYHHKNKRWIVNSAGYVQTPTTIYFKTEAAAHKFCDDLGDELDVLIGEVIVI
jgi:hypothetical protein